MIGPYSGFADEFLIGLAAFTFLFFTLPLLFAPLRWGKLMGFQIPAHTDLAVYFGRSLGVVAAASNYLALRAALTGAALAEVVAFIAALAAMMVAIHAWGAYKKIQPLSETLEIGLWVAIALAALAVYPGG